jgi:hypothetical protein
VRVVASPADFQAGTAAEQSFDLPYKPYKTATGFCQFHKKEPDIDYH